MEGLRVAVAYRYVRFDGFLYRQALPAETLASPALEVWRPDQRRWEPPSTTAIGLEASWFGVPTTIEEVQREGAEAE